MNLSRRGILRLLGATTASAASGITPREAAKALGMPSTLGVHKMPTDVYAEVGAEGPTLLPRPRKPSRYAQIERMADRFHSRSYREQHSKAMPQKFAGRKSWSHEFKMSCWKQEQELMDLFFREMRENKSFSTSVLNAFGLDFEDYEEPD